MASSPRPRRLGKRYVVVSDTHGDQIDPVMEEKFFSWIADYRPAVVVHAGDLFDFRAIRSGASLAEKSESMVSDYEAGRSFASRLFRYGSERYWLRGNHDERIWDVVRNDSGPLRDHASHIVRETEALMRKNRVKVLPYDAREGILRLGHMQIIHGYKSGKNSAAAHAAVYRNVIFGHVHTQDIFSSESLNGPEVAMGTGCLCKIDMHYNSRQTNKLRHQQGWVYGTLFPGGNYSAYQAKRIGDFVHTASEFKDF